jgi:large subunit ribosomal protein L28
MPKKTSKESAKTTIDYISESDHEYESETPSEEEAHNLHAESLVKVYAHAKEYDYENPWHPPKETVHSGSGFIVQFQDKKYLVTNAHVASQTGLLEVRLSEDDARYVATVKTIDNDCDLAVLEVKDKSFWQKTKPLELGDMPTVRQKLQVYGFPVGGEELCITEGNVSRIEVDTYSQAGTDLLQAQVSAAINPGNSGGPALSNGKIVGVAFQGSDEGEALGYIIPSLVLKHFLEDVPQPIYKGFPDLAFQYQELKSEALRNHFGMKKSQSGVRIKKVDPLSSAHGILEKDDILMSIDDIAIKNDGTVQMPFSKRLGLDYLLSKKHLDEVIKVKILRKGQELEETIPLRERTDTTKRVQLEFEKPPTYYIVSGIVMVPLTHNLLSENNVPSAIRAKYLRKPKKRPGDEVVYISNILGNEETRGYENHDAEVVKTINGKKIHNIRDAIKVVESNREKTHTIVTNFDNIIVVNNLSKAQQTALLQKLDIPQDRSKDLLSPPVFQPGFPENRLFVPAFTNTQTKGKEARMGRPTIESHNNPYGLRKKTAKTANVNM